MASGKQIEANKKNAQSCKGPTTPEGKVRSSQNAPTDSQTDRPTLSALKDRRQTDTPGQHGLDAKSEVIRVESQADYEILIAEYDARYHPTVPEERDLGDILIQSTSLGLVFDRSQNAFDKAGRRINSANRNFHQALKHPKSPIQMRQRKHLPQNWFRSAKNTHETPETQPTNPTTDEDPPKAA